MNVQKVYSEKESTSSSEEFVSVLNKKMHLKCATIQTESNPLPTRGYLFFCTMKQEWFFLNSPEFGNTPHDWESVKELYDVTSSWFLTGSYGNVSCYDKIKLLDEPDLMPIKSTKKVSFGELVDGRCVDFYISPDSEKLSGQLYLKDDRWLILHENTNFVGDTPDKNVWDEIKKNTTFKYGYCIALVSQQKLYCDNSFLVYNSNKTQNLTKSFERSGCVDFSTGVPSGRLSYLDRSVPLSSQNIAFIADGDSPYKSHDRITALASVLQDEIKKPKPSSLRETKSGEIIGTPVPRKKNVDLMLILNL
jgi:hypothetical protein